MKIKGYDITFEQYARKYDIVFNVIEDLRFTGFVSNSQPTQTIETTINGERVQMLPYPLKCYLWEDTAALFAFFVWCVSVECYKRGFNIFKSLDKNDLTNCVCDTQRFRYYFPVGFDIWDFQNKIKTRNKDIDRKTMQSIKQGYRPKKADLIEKIVTDTLQKWFI